MLPPDAPVVLLQHHGLDNLSGKTGLALLRYRRAPVLAVIDPAHAGASLERVTGIPHPAPIVASLAEALPLLPAGGEGVVAVLGLAPSGGRLAAVVRADVVAALAAGLSVASGLHTRLGDDPELAALVRPGRWIWDLRREPPDLPVASARAAALSARRLLAVGTDMSVGKMSACLELLAAARRAHLDARFVATGQAGILIAGAGVALDAVRVDYAAGAVEEAVLAAAAGAGPSSWLLVVGQFDRHPAAAARRPAHRSAAGAPCGPDRDPQPERHSPASAARADRHPGGDGGPGPSGRSGAAAAAGDRPQYRPPGEQRSGGSPRRGGGGHGAGLFRSGARRGGCPAGAPTGDELNRDVEPGG
jgi:uncharacterized NAD-dependent epimerase/dehydratase family protein